MDDAAMHDHQLVAAVATTRQHLESLQQVHPLMVQRRAITPEDAASPESDWRNVLRCLVEAQHGHATPHYIAACEAYGLLEHNGGHA